MWKKIGLIGRDRLLEREIYPRTQGKKAPFLLAGQRGVGKSAVLEWAFAQAPEPKALISANWPLRDALVAIVKAWGLRPFREGKDIHPDRAKTAELEKTILLQETGTIFLDDVQTAKPAFLQRLAVWRERFIVFAAGTPPFRREELKRCLWGLKQLEAHPLKPADRARLAREACMALGSTNSPDQVAQASRGLPARIIAMSRGEIEQVQPRAETEELDLSPLLLLTACGLVVCRYLGVGLNETDLYLIGGFGMGAMVLIRFLLARGMRDH